MFEATKNNSTECFDPLQNPSSLDDTHQDHDNRYDQKNMDQPAHGRGRDYP
jgi:hypothetical protein